MFRDFIKNHYFALVFAIIVGILMIWPYWLFIYQLGNNYQGFYPLKADAETHYLARMQEVIDGHSFGNPFLFEYKDSFPSILPTISETILAYPGKFLGIDLPVLNLFYKFFLPLIIFLLIYSLFFRLTQSKLWSIAVALVIILGDNLFNFSELINLFKGGEIYGQFAMYARPVNPQLSSILFFSYLNVLLTALRKENIKWFLLLTLIFGLSFYLYFFSWTFLLALNAVLMIIFLLLKNKKLFYKILLTTLSGVILGLPIIVTLLKVYTHPYYHYLKTIYSFAIDHPQTPLLVVSKLGALTLFFYLIYYLLTKKTKEHYFLLSLLITSFLVINVGFFMGIQLQQGHYHWYFNTPIYIIILFFIGYKVSFKFYRQYIYFIFLLITILAVAKNIFIQKSSYNNAYHEVINQQSDANLFFWLNQNTKKDSVILANNNLSELIPIYTHNNVYWNLYAAFYLLPPERIENAIFIYLVLNKVKPEEFDKVNFEKINIKLGNIFPPLKSGIYSDGIFDKYLFIWQSNFREAINKYRFDYLVLDKINDQQWNLDFLNNFKEIYQDSRFKIYQRYD